MLETLPDLVLRQIAWERDHPSGRRRWTCADYRAAWLALRAPVFRPKGTGRARPDGMRAAWALLAHVLDLGGWTPAAAAGRLGAIADAARIDALCCAYAALRMGRPGEHALIGAAGPGMGGRPGRREPARAHRPHPGAPAGRGEHPRLGLPGTLPFVRIRTSPSGPWPPTRKRMAPMGNSVYKVIEIVGTSESSWEDATAAAVATASKTLRDLRVAEVVKQDVTINEDGSIDQYRSRLSVSFKYQED